MQDHISNNKEEQFKSFQFRYILTSKIPFSELSEDIPNIEFIKENNYLIGFVVTLNKLLSQSEGEKRINDYANFISNLISIKSGRYTLPTLTDPQYVRNNGSKKVRVSKMLCMKFDIEGIPAKLDIKNDVLNLYKISPHIQLHLKYLTKSIKFYHDHSPEYSIIEAFKIIENNKKFSDYCKYFGLRNIVVHSPYDTTPNYKKNTLNSFDIYFNKNDFDYIQYQRKDNILQLILLNLESTKTQRKLNEVSIELINKIKQHLHIKN